MLKTIEEVEKNYVKELEDYEKFLNRCHSRYDGKMEPMRCWGDDDYKRIYEWNRQINAMEKILGLTKKEIEEYMEKAGINKYLKI